MHYLLVMASFVCCPPQITPPPQPDALVSRPFASLASRQEATFSRCELRGVGETLLLMVSAIIDAGVRLPSGEKVASSPAPATWTAWLCILASSTSGLPPVERFEASLTMPLREAVPLLLRRADTLLEHAIRALDGSAWANWLQIPLVAAAAKGDFDIVSMLLRAGAGGSDGRADAWMIPGGRGRTLLHAAACGGNADVVEALLGAGAGVVVNALAEGGYSPFHVAAIYGSVPAAMALARSGAVVRLKASLNKSALHFAATNGHAAMISALVVDFRLEVDEEDFMGATALHAAAYHGHAECVRALLEVGARVDSLDNRMMTPLFKVGKAVHNRAGGHESMRELLSAGARVKTLSFEGLTPLHAACGDGHVKGVLSLLRHGADESARCNRGKTPEDVTREAERRAEMHPLVADKICGALASTTADRAWRRRGWFVMLREWSKVDKTRIGPRVDEPAMLTPSTIGEATRSTVGSVSSDDQCLDFLQFSDSHHPCALPPDFCETAHAGMLDLAGTYIDPVNEEWGLERTVDWLRPDEDDVIEWMTSGAPKRRAIGDDKPSRPLDFSPPIFEMMDAPIGDHNLEQFRALVAAALATADEPFHVIVSFL